MAGGVGALLAVLVVGGGGALSLAEDEYVVRALYAGQLHHLTLSLPAHAMCGHVCLVEGAEYASCMPCRLSYKPPSGCTPHTLCPPPRHCLCGVEEESCPPPLLRHPPRPPVEPPSTQGGGREGSRHPQCRLTWLPKWLGAVQGSGGVRTHVWAHSVQGQLGPEGHAGQQSLRCLEQGLKID